jgi:lycopene cyclase domain-containing protein
MSFLYLVALLAALASMAVVDWRFGLVFWRAPVRAAIVMAVGLAFFLCWDLLGIGLDIFSRGETRYLTGIVLAPELPLEELFFLTFLCYLTLVAVNAARFLAHQGHRR